MFGTTGTDLRGPLRDGASDDALREIIARVWAARADRYSEARAGLVQIEGRERERMEMYQIGG